MPVSLTTTAGANPPTLTEAATGDAEQVKVVEVVGAAGLQAKPVGHSPAPAVSLFEIEL